VPADDTYVKELADELAVRLAAAFAEVLAPLTTGDRPLLSIRQAAARLGVKERKLQQMLEQGELGYVLVGDRRKIEAEQIDAFIAARRSEASDG